MARLLLTSVAFGLLHSASGESRCTADGSCSLKNKLPDGEWWRKEINAAQPKCREIDPDNVGTCHQWTVELSKGGQATVLDIKTMLSDFIKTTNNFDENHRVLDWNDQMDELYLSAPKNVVGSDKVFVTPHIDGFFGLIPFVRAWRCVYGLTGPHNTVTVQPMRNPDQREVTLGPGIFTCFDYNREIHWIENRVNASSPELDERMVLKIHFYDYPSLLPKWLGDAFGQLNAEYNFFARRAFLVSQFPDRSWFSKAVGGVINSITLFGGRAEKYFGYVNIGIVLAFIFAAHFRKYDLLSTAGIAPYGIAALALIFRSVTLGQFTRDAMALKATSVALLGLSYGHEFLRSSLSLGALFSLVLVAVGLGLAYLAYEALGPDLTYYGKQFGVVDAANAATEWPYGATGIPHPMVLGSVLALTGLRLHPTFGPKFSRNFLLHIACDLAVLAVEVFDVHLPAGMDYRSTLAEFLQFHQQPGNIYAHLLTTVMGVMGVLGLVNNVLYPSSAADKTSKNAYTNAPLITLAWTWLVVRYTVPDSDAANLTVLVMTLCALGVWAVKPPAYVNVLLLALGVGLQEFAHHHYGEVTYMASYANLTPQAALTFALHNIWLLPFELRAAVNSLSQFSLPSTSL